VRTPNSPGYVSRHSPTSAAAAEMLSAAFPDRARPSLRMAKEAGFLRLLGGIHIRANDEANVAGAVRRVASATPWSR
jgi:hypothetical protein